MKKKKAKEAKKLIWPEVDGSTVAVFHLAYRQKHCTVPIGNEVLTSHHGIGLDRGPVP